MGFHSVFRVAATTVSLAAMLGGFGAHAAETAQDKCRGVDMLAETKARDPALYRQIMAQAEATKNAGTVLWKIERGGRPGSYERVTHLSPAVQFALSESKTIALEVSDLSEQATSSVISKSAPLLIYTDGRRLDGLLSDSEYEAVKNVIARSGMPVDLAALFKPWIVTMILSVSDCEREKVQRGDPVLDMKIAEIGKARGMQVVGLETIPEQLEALASVPESQQLNMLRASLKFADRANDLMETLVQLYLGRKIAAAMPFQIAIARQVGVNDDAYAGFQQKLLVERNAKMRAAAEPLLEKGGVFIAIGALHLSGDKGLVALLQQSGYTLTPIE
jgi:uncharacterized protein